MQLNNDFKKKQNTFLKVLFFLSLFIVNFKLASFAEANKNECEKALIYIPFVKKFAKQAFQSTNLKTCNYYSMGAYKYSKSLSIHTNKCDCSDYIKVKEYILAEKAYLTKELDQK